MLLVKEEVIYSNTFRNALCNLLPLILIRDGLNEAMHKGDFVSSEHRRIIEVFIESIMKKI